MSRQLPLASRLALVLAGAAGFAAGPLAGGAAHAVDCVPLDCNSNGTCDTETGTCACDAGFAAPDCSECDPGNAGPGCAPCTCVNGMCDEGIAGNGQCIVDSCDVGYYGVDCDVACPGFTGVDECTGNGTCDGDPVVPACTCDPGFYGDDCAGACTTSCPNGTCDDGAAGTGACEACDPGFFGPSCLPCTCVNGTCDDGLGGDGQCTGACDAGFVGANCDLACPTGDAGSGVQVCSGQGSCSEVGGVAVCTCGEGRYGAACNLFCPGVVGVAADGSSQCGNTAGVTRGTCNDGASGDGDCVCAAGWYIAAGPDAGLTTGAGVCTATVCGDGNPRGAELCDDGDAITTDNCPSGPGVDPDLCQPARCGDGFTNTEPAVGDPAREECDDGNDVNTDACVKTSDVPSPRCRAARCGDGIQRLDIVDPQSPLFEECDDGNANNNDACTNACNTNVCGDGFQGPGEFCDDGNHDNADACPDDVANGGTCQAPTCGDGFVNLAGTDAGTGAGFESCDQGAGSPSGDGCSASCQIEAGYTCNGLKNTTCAAECKTDFTFSVDDYDWRNQAGTSVAFARSGSVWRAPASGSLPATPGTAGLQHPIAIPNTGQAREPSLVIGYTLGAGATDCMRVYITPTRVVGAALPVATRCGSASGTSLTVPLAAYQGAVQWLTVRLEAIESIAGRAGLSLGSVVVRTDYDNDGQLDFATIACGDDCVDKDGDGHGDTTSQARTACVNNVPALPDCNDNAQAVNPSAFENCGDSVDNNCDGQIDAQDQVVCKEDCANGIDDGTNGLADCLDPVCTGVAFGVAGADENCMTPCLRQWSFDTGPSITREDMTPGGTVNNIWVYDAAGGAWATTGLVKGPGSTRQFGRLQMSVSLTKAFAGPEPTLNVTFDHDGAAAGRDVLAICLSTSGPPTCQGNDPTLRLLRDTPTDDAVNGGNLTVPVDLSAFYGASTLYIAVLFDTFEANQYDADGVVLKSVVLGSDADEDGVYEGRYTQNGATCDPCWDVDGDFYGDELSPDLTLCAESGPGPLPLFDCDDTRDTVTPAQPDERGFCGDGLNNDCDFGPGGIALVDGDDPDCGTEDCADGIDNNDDNLVDCQAPVCANGSVSCELCRFGYDFDTGTGRDTGSATSTGSSNGWAPTVPGTQGRLWDYTGQPVTFGAASALGWGTRTGTNNYGAASATAGRVRGWLTRRVTVPTAMPSPELVVTYALTGDGTKDRFGVCFNVDPTTCGYQTGSTNLTAGVVWSQVTNTSGLVSTEIAIPKGQVDVVFFFDTSDGVANTFAGAFIDEVIVRSDVDSDGTGEYFGRTCDQCVDVDADGFGDDSYAVTVLLECANPDVRDCDDGDARRNPGLDEACYAPEDTSDLPGDPDDGINRDNDCDGVNDSAEVACRVCGNSRIEVGETCDDGDLYDQNPQLDDPDDGCFGCQIQSGDIYISEIHLPIINNNAAEQWIELRNGLGTDVDLSTLGAGLVYDHGTPSTADDHRVDFGDPADCEVRTSYVMAADLPGRRPYYVIAFGAVGSSDFADTTVIDMVCPDFGLSEVGVGKIRLFRGGSPIDANKIDDVSPGTLVCGDGALETALSPVDIRGRSLMLRTDASDQSANDSGSAWCLAGREDTYSVTGKHFGSPGFQGRCGELACDDKDDDCDGTVDETTPYPTLPRDPIGSTQPRELTDGDADGVCDDKDCDPTRASCDFATSAPACTSDADGDGDIDCKDACNDPDEDGYSTTGSVATPACLFEPAECENNRDAFPRASERVVPLSCQNGINDDCDAFADCLDNECSSVDDLVNATGLPGTDGVPDLCPSETCDTVQPVTCGQTISITPTSVDFQTCMGNPLLSETGPDRVYRFVAPDTGAVDFRTKNVGTRRFGIRVTEGACSDKGDADACAAPVAELAGSSAPAQSEGTCAIGGASLPVDVTAGTSYFVLVKSLDVCANGPRATVELTVSCSEVGRCNDGIDQDANGKTDCADAACVFASNCLDLDFDGDGVANRLEQTCGTSPTTPTESPTQDGFLSFDNDALMNCVDPDDDNDGALDAVEIATCMLEPGAKNDPVIFPRVCNSSDCKLCDEVNQDADCNGLFDTTEPVCGVREDNCANNVDDDNDGNEDCEDQDCVPNSLCRCGDYDGDFVSNEFELACDTDPLQAGSKPATGQADDLETPGTAISPCDADGLGDGIPNCSDPDDDNDGFPDTEETVCGSNPVDKNSKPLNTDGDTQCDAVDPNDDNDQFVDNTTVPPTVTPFTDELETQCQSDPKNPASTPWDATHDVDGDRNCNALDLDDDGDGWLDFEEASCETNPLDDASNPTALGQDLDDDHLCDTVDLDDDNDGWKDLDEIACGTDPRDGTEEPLDSEKNGAGVTVGDGICDAVDGDDDGDGVPDTVEILCGTDRLDAGSKPLGDEALDFDLDEEANCVDLDDDNDDVSDANEILLGSLPRDADSDDDGLDDGEENVDHDGVIDATETSPLKKDTDADALGDKVEADSCYRSVVSGTACLPSSGVDTDSDDDGLPDAFEDLNKNGATDATETSPVLADSDGDGEDDGFEVECAVDPLDADSLSTDHDENGVCDGKQLDSDGDGIADGVETFCGTDPLDGRETPSLDDLDQADDDTFINCVDPDDDNDDVVDEDELECGYDARDAAEEPTSEEIGNYDEDTQLNCSDPDDDNDDLTDVQEAAASTNPKDSDTDDDGLPDGLEVVRGFNPTAADSDDDKISDGVEFGLTTADPDTAGTFQPDLDPTTTTDAKNPDTDGDGVIDGDEDTNQNGRVDPGEGNPKDPTDGLRDTDGDGLIDREEEFVYNTDKNNPDSDGDQLTDKIEVQVTNTDPNDPDSDDGGIIDGFEERNGTDPNVKGDDFLTTTVEGDSVFSCSGGTGAATLVLGLLAALALIAVRRRGARAGR